MQCAGFRQLPPPLLQDVDDVFRAVRAELRGILYCAGDLVGAVYLAQGHDAPDMMPGIHSMFSQVTIIFVSLRRELQEALILPRNRLQTKLDTKKMNQRYS